MKKLSKLLFASIGLVLCTSMLSTHSTSAQRSWHISGYPKAGSLRSTNAISGNGRYYTTHLFMCSEQLRDRKFHPVHVGSVKAS